MRARVSFLSLLASLLLPSSFLMAAPSEESEAKARFETLNALEWLPAFHDNCIEDWKQKWTLDGMKAHISNDASGMSFSAGPTPQDQASHAVLWTKDSFAGDIKIEYEYTRLDNATKYVNILYVQATGSGEGSYAKDISQWSELRKVPWMKTYFHNMDTYHISYAAYGNDGSPDKNDYIRARRYLPLNKNDLNGTALEPDYRDTGFFAQEVPHKITVIKKGDELFMRIESQSNDMLCHWKTDSFPSIIEGRIGLRHMWTRSASYANFRVSELGN